jgi:hypothetical protein
MCGRMNGRARDMARDHMLWSPSPQVAHGDARVSRSWSRLSRKLVHELLCRLGWEENPRMRDKTPAMPHVTCRAAVRRRTMRSTPGGVRRRGPRRGTQRCDTTQDEQGAHTVSSGDSQASSPSLFDQSAGFRCKLNPQSECFFRSEARRGNERRWFVRTVVAAFAAGLSGTIDEIGQQIDPNRPTAVIKGHVDNPKRRIRAGQYVTATVNIPLK